MTRAMHRSLLASLLLGAPALAPAGEGVIEINQARVLAGGISASDTPGFPATLDRSGSYVLTGNLELGGVPNAINLSGIQVLADDVSIDLNGFGVVGAVRCSGNPPDTAVTCTPNGATGVGIDVSGTARRAWLHDGRVEGFAQTGVFCAAGCVVERIAARHNDGDGVFVADGSIVRDSIGELNLGSGLRGLRTMVASSVALRNGGQGLNLSYGSVVYDTVATRNAGFGLFVAAFGESSSAVAHRACSFTNNNGGNANAQIAAAAVELGPSICGGDTTCP